MRVAQIFDQQLVEIDRLEVVRGRGTTTLRVEIRCDEYLARRIHAKLYRMPDIQHAALANADDDVVSEGELPNPSAPESFDPLTPQP
ncbi:MAG: hypothetical protein PW789_15400 [Edaphobacter sp.]|uniref:hypothetical protein n=1 Tax=Edaphobacter sp. TaxID=1934404 RepID=UPI0023840B49|nr:hypothetical protein [Edaphobacter sp.]MDE1177964.1 hypothetical protein [Edaphobacter sp.]